jgi:hypothetical protein
MVTSMLSGKTEANGGEVISQAGEDTALSYTDLTDQGLPQMWVSFKLSAHVCLSSCISATQMQAQLGKCYQEGIREEPEN